ncbi:MAG: CRTAC1 family protein [Rhodothermales bacterium]
MRAFIYHLTVALCAWGLGCGPEPAGEHAEAEAAWFHEGAREAGVDFVHVRAQTLRHWFPEIMSGGAAWLDYDGDGDLDLYLVQGGDLDPHTAERPGNRLFRNRGDGAFEDVTEAAGVGDQGYGMGCAVGDYDGDGDLDLYVTNVGPNVLYRNAGDGTFEDVTTQAGVGHPGWGTSAAFIDYDDDGHLDLYVVNYIDWSPEQEITCFAGGTRDYCHPENYNASATDVLYHNAGDGTFVDRTRASGIFRAKGNGLGLTHGDFNGDGLADFYVANDGNPNQLWINQGDGAFTDQALRSGSAVNRQGSAEAGMGVVAADLENDGDLDLFITHLRDETNTLYRNQEGLFEDATVRTGLSTPSIPYTGFGVGLADFDHDGALDLYVANGRVGRTLASLGEDPYGEPNQLFRGLGDGRFEEVMPRGGLARPLIGTSRAAVFGDYDGDGDIDVLVVNNDGRAHLLENQVGHRGRWILFRVVDRRGRNAIGARVRITAAGRRQWRLVQRAYSYLSSNDPRVHFGLAEAEQVEEVMVVWPGGRQESFGPFAAGAVHELREGGGKSL